MASKNDDVVMITADMEKELKLMGSGLTPEEMERKAKEQEAK